MHLYPTTTSTFPTTTFSLSFALRSRTTVVQGRGAVHPVGDSPMHLVSWSSRASWFCACYINNSVPDNYIVYSTINAPSELSQMQSRSHCFHFCLLSLSLFPPQFRWRTHKGLLTQGRRLLLHHEYMGGETEEQKDEYIVVDCTHTHTS